MTWICNADFQRLPQVLHFCRMKASQKETKKKKKKPPNKDVVISTCQAPGCLTTSSYHRPQLSILRFSLTPLSELVFFDFKAST